MDKGENRALLGLFQFCQGAVFHAIAIDAGDHLFPLLQAGDHFGLFPVRESHFDLAAVQVLVLRGKDQYALVRMWLELIQVANGSLQH